MTVAPVGLVLLPGMDGTGDLFEPLKRAMGTQRAIDVVRYPAQQVLGYEELTPLVRAQLPAQAPFVLLGESFSGPLAISIAASPPPGLQGLILCCSFAQRPVPAMALLPRNLFGPWIHLALSKAMRAPMRHMLLGRAATPQLAMMLDDSLSQVSGAVMTHRMKEMQRVNVLDRLAQVRVPALYLQARQDRLVPRARAAAMQRRLPALQVVQLDGPHGLLQASPEASARAIEKFCSDLQPLAP